MNYIEEEKEKKQLIDGFGRKWNRNYVPDHIKELNENPIGIDYPDNNYVFSRHLKLKNYPEYRIDVEFELSKEYPYCRMFTDDVKYGSHLEIVFDNSKQCFILKDLDRLRSEWRKKHPEENVIDDVLNQLIMED